MSSAATPDTAPPSALAPLSLPTFRMLWATWLVANVCMWMSDVAAAWMMTSLTTTPIWVALVQTASTLPVFLLGLPSGAMADILDRRRYFILTQFWVAGVALLMCVTLLAGWMSPPLLLALTFANGIGLAMRWPVFAAIVPELVPRTQLPAALALNGAAMNGSRIIGPLVAGALIASAGTLYVFLLNAVLSVIAGFVIMRWRRVAQPNPLGREKFFSAMRVGMQFVAHSARLRVVLLRIAIFYSHCTAVLALLPLLARGLPGGGAGTFTLLLAAMGLGAVLAVLFLPRMRQAMNLNQRVAFGTTLQAASMAVMAFAPNVWVAVPTMFLGGVAWITVANSLSVSAQMALPNWVRARGMSMYQMALMGSGALGAALWGQVATWSSVQTSLLIAAASAMVTLFLAHQLVQRVVPARGDEEDLTPSHELALPVLAEPPATGHVLVTIEYRIDPAQEEAFRDVMQDYRSSRLRRGALKWELIHDLGQPGVFVEHILDESWTGHLRRISRMTADDAELRRRARAFHIGDGGPAVRRFVVDGKERG
jgi:MFS family permease